MKQIKRFSTFTLALMFIAVGVAACINPVISMNADTEGKRYQRRGANLIRAFTERVDYTASYPSSYSTNPQLPDYAANTLNSYGTCGVTAGGNIVAWYNKTYSGLIPGHTAGKLFFGSWIWTIQNSYIDALLGDLSVAMDETVDGVTISEYHQGMTSYVTGKSRTYTKTSLMNPNGTLNFEAAAEALDDDKLISIFVDGFNMIYLTSYSGYDLIYTEEYGGAHVMSVCGYGEIKYHDANGLFRTDTYFIVQTGLGLSPMLLKLNSSISIEDCYITHIS